MPARRWKYWTALALVGYSTPGVAQDPTATLGLTSRPSTRKLFRIKGIDDLECRSLHWNPEQTFKQIME